MTLHASWNALFNLLTTVNKSVNQNIAGFTGMMDFNANPKLKMFQLNQDYNFLLVANSTREVTILHNPYNFGRTLLCPTDKVGCLVGKGPSAFLVIVNNQASLCSIQVTVPPAGDITNCLTIDNFAALPTPTATRRGPSNLNGLSSFFPAPFLCNAILAEDSASPLALILAGRAAREEHIPKHGRDKGFDEGIVNAHVELFSLWCIEVHKGQLEESCFSIAPDNKELVVWSARLYREHILQSLELASAVPPSTTDTTNLLQSLAAGITRTTKEAKLQNKIQCKQLDYIKEKYVRKKNKAEKWHHMSQCIVLNSASINSNSPTKEFPESYLRIINSTTARMADRELRLLDAGFTHGLATSLYMGDIMQNTRTTPSNLSPFTIFELDPLSSMQTAQFLHLHLLSKNTKGKSLDEIKASQIQEIKAPGTFKELLQALQF
jgi:hypothetical protein